MAEVKNAFISSKMNKDLDARLVPSGEYRDANNVQVSRSEGSDVGALENVLGNIKVAQFESNENLSCIGCFADEPTGFIYLFLTDNLETKYVPSASNYIYRFNSFNNTKLKLAEGAFLNFSKLNPITGVNVLENLLFWTDNRNQPRKINLVEAAFNNQFYNNEDKISVAKYNPWQPILLYKESVKSAGNYETTMKDVVSKFLPNGGQAFVNAASTGTTISIDTSTLNIPFYPLESNNETENIPKAGMKLGKIVFGGGDIVDLNAIVSSYNNGTITASASVTVSNNDILIFNPNPYYDSTYNGDDDFLRDKFVRFSYRFKFNDGENSLIAPFTQPVFIPEQDGYFLNNSKNTGDQQQTFNSTIVNFMRNKINQVALQIQLPTSLSLLSSDYDIKSIDILYKESDSLAMQVIETVDISNETNSDKYYEYIYKAQKPFRTLPSDEITRVYDKVPVKALSQEVISNRIVYGNYINKHTPPDFINYEVAANNKLSFNLQDGTASNITGGTFPSGSAISIDTAENVISIGSVITTTTPGNTIPNNTLVTDTNGSTSITLNKNVTLTSNASLVFNAPSSDQHYTSTVEYPSSSLKTNRNYQVGVVLSDRYGRSSTVILNRVDRGASTVFLPYEEQIAGQNPINWLGNALRLSFNEPIDGSTTGIYNGNTNSTDYNPLGWYSYKIVVKQLEQDYYNVYTAGAIKGDPFYKTTEAVNQNTSYITLLNDNINKVPRDLSEVGPQDKTFRSSVKLFGRVENTQALVEGEDNYSNRGNAQYYPYTRFFTTNNIEDLYDLFDTNQFEDNNKIIPVVDVKNPYYAFFKAESNPFVGEFVTSNIENNQFGVVNLQSTTANNQEFSKVNNLAIFETAPTLSRIDIFYETSTAGLISDLNNAVLNASNASSGFSEILEANFLESLNGLENISNAFFLVNTFGSPIDANDITSPLVLTSVIDETGTSLQGYFNLIGNQTNGFNVQTTSKFTQGGIGEPSVYYDSEANFREFTFNFEVEVNGVLTTPSFSLDLVNVAPQISSCPSETIDTITNDIITTLFATNGAHTNNVNKGTDITWSIASITKRGEPFEDTNNVFSLEIFNEQPSRCILKNTGPTIGGGDYVIEVQAEDAGGLTDSCFVNLDLGVVPLLVAEVELKEEDLDPYGGSISYYTITEFTIEESNGVTGYYVKRGGWNYSSTANILLDKTNAIKSSSDSCNQSNWYYSSVSISGAYSLWRSCETFDGDISTLDEVVAGAVFTLQNGTYNNDGISIIDGGTGYTSNQIRVSPTGGSGTGLQIDYIVSGGTITGVRVSYGFTRFGENYAIGDELVIPGGNGNARIRVNQLRLDISQNTFEVI